MRFNTASGKHYCNRRLASCGFLDSQVSIPQAVSTIAIWRAGKFVYKNTKRFNTASGKHYCNSMENTRVVM